MKIGILGGAGYTGGELIRILLNHPQAEIVFVNSESNAGRPVTDVHEGLYGETDLCFTDGMPFGDVDVLFFCFGHGKSRQFLAEHDVPGGVRIIDMAQDFRLAAPGNDFVYGLPEINRSRIAAARHVANPGCFATCIQLGLLPAAKMGLLTEDIAVNAITGSTGAGQKPGATTHFSWRTDNISIYKPFTHQHVPEIRQSLAMMQGGLDAGIEADERDIVAGYEDFYRDEPFTRYVGKPLDLKQVVNTNKCLVHCEKYGNKLLITSCIDNLLKGAVGQAVQNMNIMFGLEETAGLRLKPSAF